ncbi:MAG: DUF1963 domain-containing protein [Neisseriaceae bacterium]|nr:DUF1963 domain-containing protein [Neisseriaceae bacterium]
MSNKRQQILDWLEQNRRPEIRIQFQKAEQPLAIGASKIGGCPDVPAGFVWPRVQGGGSYGYKDAPAEYQQEPIDYPSPKVLMAEYEKCTPEFVSQFNLPPDASDEEVARLVAMAEKEIPNLCQQCEITPKKMQSPSHRQFVYEHHLKNLPQMAGVMKMQHKMMSLFLSDEDLKNYENGVIEDNDIDDGSVPFDRPLAFMAQFNLSEVADLDKENLLPKQGHLLFFYDYAGLDYGETQDCVRVLYFPPDLPLTQMPLPDDMDKHSRIPELQVSFQAGSNVPDSERTRMQFDDIYDELDDDDTEKLWGEGRGDYVPKLLGYADTIQGCMEEECALRAAGLEWDDYHDKPEIKAQIDKEKDDWILLFQLDEIDWGDTDYTNTPADFSGLYELQNNISKALPMAGKAFGNYVEDMQTALEKGGVQVTGKPQEEKKSFLSSLMGGIFGRKEMTAEDMLQEMQTAKEKGDLQKMFENEDDDDIEENIADEADDDMGGLIFGDGGCLYIFIRKQDLAAGDFSQVRFSVQSH